MNTTRMMAVAVLIAGSGMALRVMHAQQPGIMRRDVVRHDLGVAGREVIQVRVDFAQGSVTGFSFPPAVDRTQRLVVVPSISAVASQLPSGDCATGAWAEDLRQAR
jgi:hypothetical protein